MNAPLVAELIEAPARPVPVSAPSASASRPGRAGLAPAPRQVPGVAGPAAGGSPRACPLRPGELPAPPTMAVLAADLSAGDRVLLGRRVLVVEALARRADGMVRVVLADGICCTCPPDAPWEVCRG